MIFPLLSASVRTYLGLQEDNVGEIKPDSYPDYKVKCIIKIIWLILRLQNIGMISRIV
jgi:hypothetical protein